VAVVTNSGGTGVELTDLLADQGLVVPELSEPLQKELRAIMPAYASAQNPVDMTPAWKLFATVYPSAIEMLARSGEVDVVVPVLLQRSASAEVALAVRDAVERLRADSVPVPVYVCWVAPRSADQHAQVLHEAGVPCFTWPERTAQVAGVAVRCGQGLRAEEEQAPGDVSGAPEDLAALQRRTQAHRALRAAMAPPPGPLPAAAPNGFLPAQAARDLLVATGIPVIETVRCRSAASAAAAAESLGYPVVAKVDHPDLVHKSDAGGVRLGLGSGAEVAEAAAELLGLAAGASVLVQRQHRGVELLVGGVRDPDFGAMVMTGFGGLLVETQRDVQLAVAPVDTGQALAMLSSLRGAPIFGGLRGSPPIPLGFVAEIIVAVGDLMVAHPELAELDLNPVLAGPRGCVAVDWRIGTR
jgi:acetyltransferase